MAKSSNGAYESTPMGVLGAFLFSLLGGAVAMYQFYQKWIKAQKTKSKTTPTRKSPDPYIKLMTKV